MILAVSWLLLFGFFGVFTNRWLEGYQTTANAIRVVIATLLSYAWYVHPNWVTINSVALCMGLFVLMQLKDITLKQVLTFSIAIMTYDAVAVFGTKMMQEVAASVSAKETLAPIVVFIPRSFAIESDRVFIMGLGDIVIPGAIIMMAINKARQYAAPLLSVGAITGYVAGALVSFAMLFGFQHPQPATIYLIPGALAGFLVPAWYYGLVKKSLSD